MRPFSYVRAADLPQAVRLGQHTGQGQTDAPVQFLAGGTTLYDLMKLDVMVPEHVVDLTPLRAGHASIAPGADGLHLGAFARMAHVAADPVVRADYPVLAESLQLAASAQLRNMATLGGNVLQRTRCTYFRDPSLGGLQQTHILVPAVRRSTVSTETMPCSAPTPAASRNIQATGRSR